MPMNYADFAKESAKYQKSPRTNKWKAQSPSALSVLKISLKTGEKKYFTTLLFVSSNLIRRIPIGHTSPSLVSKSTTPTM